MKIAIGIVALIGLILALRWIKGLIGQALKATTRQINGVTVVDFSGDATGDGGRVLRDTVYELLGRGQKRILLNFKGVRKLDAFGAGALAESVQAVSGQGGKLVLFALNKRRIDLPQVTQVCTLVDVVDIPEADAVRRCSR